MDARLSILRWYGPSDRPPAADEIRARLEPFAAWVPLGADGPPPDAPWEQGWRSPEGDRHLLTWAAVDPPSPELDFIHARLPPPAAARVREARGALVLATELDTADPLAAYARQLRLGSIALPEAVALQDVSSGRVVSAHHVRTVASWATPPPPTEIYFVEAIRPDQRGGRWWVHTHGLARTALPDVEVLGVPEALVESAVDLVQAFVRAHLLAGVPLRGEARGEFRDHGVAWRPATEAARALRPGEIGGGRDRPASHAGRRIALVDLGADGVRLRPPLALLRSFRDGRAAVCIPAAEGDRAARLARERWSVFARVHARFGRDPAWSFAACFRHPAEGGRCENLWWLVDTIDGDGVEGRLASDPIAVPGLAPGDRAASRGSDLVDWVVYAPTHEIHPATVAEPDGTDVPEAAPPRCRVLTCGCKGATPFA